MYFLQNATSGGAALAYFDLGAREDVARVFLGGLGSAGTVAFARISAHPLLGQGRNLLVDVIGSGWSDHDDDFSHTIDDHAATIADLLDAAGLSRIELIGHSLGGSIAISLASQRPDLVARLIVAEPNLDPGVGSLSTIIAAYDEDSFAASGHAALIAQNAAAKRAVNFQSSRTLRRWSARGLHRTAVSLLADRPVTFRNQLTLVSCPKIYISGEQSGEDIAALRTTGSDVRVVPKAGHILHWDNPDGFAAALTN